jgi:methyl-accepting chemotaxis protein
MVFSIRMKLAIIMLAFLIPISALTWQLVHKMDENILFSEQQIKGIRYEKPLLMLLNEIADYQIAVLNKQSGNSDAEKEMAEGAASINALFSEVMKLNHELGVELGLTPEMLKERNLPEQWTAAYTQQQWNEIQSQEYSADAYTALLANLHGMVNQIGNTSNMILDPDLDSFYLVDASLNSFPATLEKLALIKSSTFDLLSANGNTIPADKRFQMLLDVQAIKEFYLTHTVRAINTSIREDTNFNGVSPSLQTALKPALEQYSDGAQQLIDALALLAKGEGMEAAHFIEIGDIMHDGTAELGQVTLSELQRLIEIRIAALQIQKQETLGSCAIAVIIAFGLFIVVSSGISGPIKHLTKAMQSLADGDVSVNIPCTNKRDEIGKMARTVVVFKQNAELLSEAAKNFDSSVKHVVEIVASAATEMDSASRDLTTRAAESHDRLKALNVDVTDVSASMQSVATASEQLYAAINEISTQVHKSTSNTTNAVKETTNVKAVTDQLAEASQKVGDILSIINSIAAKITLLSLNATIEAARAGEAGKGFAVVANEVKDLASQTAQATANIGQLIGDMQSCSQGTVVAIGQITGLIEEINHIAGVIAAAVEEQGVATRDIGSHILTATKKVEAITDNISGVTESAAHSSAAASQTLQASGDLSKQSETLRGEVDKFLKTLKAA